MTKEPGSRPAWARVLPPVLAFLLVAGLGAMLLRPAKQTTAAGSALVGQTAPDFDLKALSGEQIRLSALRGQPVVLNFWASWCGPCQQEAPLLHTLSTRQQAEQFRVVGLLFQETDAARAKAFIAQHGLNYPNIQAPNLDTAIAYNISGIPVTVFIDKAGVVQQVDRGGLDAARLNAGLAKIGVAAVGGAGI